MVLDRLKTSGFLELQQAEFKLSSWERDLCRVPAGREAGREAGEAGNNAAIQAPHSAQPHLFTWPVPTSEKGVPPTSISSHTALNTERSERLFCWKAAVSNLVYGARADRADTG